LWSERSKCINKKKLAPELAPELTDLHDLFFGISIMEKMMVKFVFLLDESPSKTKIWLSHKKGRFLGNLVLKIGKF